MLTVHLPGILVSFFNASLRCCLKLSDKMCITFLLSLSWQVGAFQHQKLLLVNWDIENPSWAPARNRVHLSKFVFQKSRASDFCGMQTQHCELCSAPMIDSISSTMFSATFHCHTTQGVMAEIGYRSLALTA